MNYNEIEFGVYEESSYYGILQKLILTIRAKLLDGCKKSSLLLDQTCLNLQMELHKIDEVLGDVKKPFINEILVYIK